MSKREEIRVKLPVAPPGRSCPAWLVAAGLLVLLGGAAGLAYRQGWITPKVAPTKRTSSPQPTAVPPQPRAMPMQPAAQPAQPAPAPSVAEYIAQAKQLKDAGRYDEAIVLVQTNVLPVEPDSDQAHNVMAWSYLEKGDTDGARAEFQAVLALTSDPGMRRDAEGALDRMGP